MVNDWQESGLYFDFKGAKTVISLDKHGHGLSHILKAVDFVVEWDDQFWLVEVKNPEDSEIPSQYKDKAIEKYFKKITTPSSSICDDLYQKFVDSLLYLGLDCGIPSEKPMRYMTLIALSALTPIQLSNLLYKLLAISNGLLQGPPKKGWSKGFSVHLFNLELWNRAFPQCQVTRVEKGESSISSLENIQSTLCTAGKPCRDAPGRP
jgi:hypothetical protein